MHMACVLVTRRTNIGGIAALLANVLGRVPCALRQILALGLVPIALAACKSRSAQRSQASACSSMFRVLVKE